MTPATTPVAQLLIPALVVGASLAAGYVLGSPTRLPVATAPEQDGVMDATEEASDGDLSAITPSLLEPCKMVLVVRTDLNMTNGKIAIQCGHATIACYRALAKKNPKLLKHWEQTGQAKIALKGKSEDQLLELEAIAKSLNLCARLIREVDTGTVLGIGPAPVALVNEVTGKLRLL